MGHLAQSVPGEESVIFNQVPDDNGEQPLPHNLLFGDLVAGAPIIPPMQAANAIAQGAAPALGVLVAKTDTQAAEALAWPQLCSTLGQKPVLARERLFAPPAKASPGCGGAARHRWGSEQHGRHPLSGSRRESRC